MSKIYSSPDVYLKDTGSDKGKGVFAARSFIKDEVIEVASVLVMRSSFKEMHPALKQSVYSWGALTKTGAACGLALGYGSLYNHANPANMRYDADAGTETISYVAVRDINKDEELSVNYSSHHGEHESKVDQWFINRGVTPI